MADKGPKSSSCYHGEHEKCPGSEHCGCECHDILTLEETGNSAATVQEIQEARTERDYYRQRLYDEMDKNHALNKQIEALKAELAALRR